jgi:folate-binding protein YgfZ
MLNNYRLNQGQFKVEFWTFVFTGADVTTFLQAQSTFDIRALAENSFHLGAFLDPQGRTECFGWLVKEHERHLLLVPSSHKEIAIERMNRYLISEDVEIHGPTLEGWWFILGPMAPKSGSHGMIFFEPASLLQYQMANVPVVPEEDVELWRGLTGHPKFDGSDISKEIINNQMLFDLAVSNNKGCYPGQETVSKIATRRGAAYAPVLLEVKEHLIPVGASASEVNNFGKRIGTATACFEWEGKYYLATTLLRDFRVEKMEINFELNGQAHNGIVRYYPLLVGDPKQKAQELFWAASDHFKQDDLKAAEEFFRMAMALDPSFADAYEGLGVMLGRQERFQEAIEIMQELSIKDPDSVLAHTNMSLYLMRLGKIEEAEEQKSQATLKSFKHFGKEAKSKEEAQMQKKAQQEEWAKRESMFLQVLEIDDEDTLANYGVGSIAVEKGEWERARAHLEKVIKADPKYSVAYLALGKAYKGLGLKEEAKQTWQDGIKIAAAKGDLMPANQMHSELDRA